MSTIDAQAHIAKTLDNVNGGTYKWENDEVVELLLEITKMIAEDTKRPTAKYMPGKAATDDEEATDAHLVCAKCEGTEFYEVDTAIRWTEVEGDPDGLNVCYSGSGDYESDHLRCASCGTGHNYPDEWSDVVEVV